MKETLRGKKESESLHVRARKYFINSEGMVIMKRRHKGEGSIIKLSNGSYKATITIGKGIDGKQKRRSVTCKTQTELMDKITELRVHVKHQ